MRKQLPTDTVIDDLAGSPFFRRRGPNDAPAEPRSDTPVREETPPAGDLAGSSPRPVAASPDRPATMRRTIVRRGFDYYEDQLRALKKLSLQEQLAGRDGSMSEMLRHALDEYLKKRLHDSDK